jgi:phosphoserine phosphatase RsbU/P
MEARKRRSHLMLRLFWTYLCGLMVGAFYITLNNMLIHRKTIYQLWEFNLKVLLIAVLIFALLLCAYSYLRLGSVMRGKGPRAFAWSATSLHQRLYQFPMELFIGVMVISSLLIALYHALEQYHRTSSFANINWISLGDSLLNEFGLALFTALLLFSFTRSQLRPYMNQLRVYELEGKGLTGVYPLIVTFVSCYFIVVNHAGRYLLVHFAPDSGDADIGRFLLLFGAYFTLGVTLFVIHLKELRDDTRALIAGMNRLRKAGSQSMHQPLPILSRGELGSLAAAFNQLQRSMHDEYKELERQLKLAYDIQKRLLPATLPNSPYVEIAARCDQSLEVGGDFYLIEEAGQDRLLMAIGDVTGHGMPAALLMSAAMVALRKEIERGGAPEDILRRMNKHILEIAGGTSFVTLGIALLDLQDGRSEYAGAGHMAPYIVRTGRVQEIDSSSLPLGIDPDADYRSCTWTMEPDDVMVLYTDGIVEARQGDGTMLGFEAWERELLGVRGAASLEEQLARMLEQRALSEGTEHRDDRTVVMVRRMNVSHL